MTKLPKFTIDITPFLELDKDVHTYLTDKNHRIIAANKLMTQVTNEATSPQYKNNFIGKTLSEVWQNNPILHPAIKENEKVIRSKSPKIFLNVLSAEENYTIYMLTIKMPIYDSENNVYVFGMSYYLEKSSENIARNLGLTKIEFQCLSHLINGKTYKQIAKILKRSPRTIEHRVENIKTKLGATNKSELLTKVKESINQNIFDSLVKNKTAMSIPLD